VPFNRTSPQVIERLVPTTVATSETREDLLQAELFPEETSLIARAVEKRRREFMTGRACARNALRQLGIAPVAILKGARGEPLWPLGIVGSITHCQGYRASAVALASNVISIGIDADEDAPLAEGLLERIAFGPELELAGRDDPASLDQLLFCAKEAVYKAWFPLTRRSLGFKDVEVTIDPEHQTLTARLLVCGPAMGGIPSHELHGRWCAEDGILCAAVVIPSST
jgi:4'-phosphopantetheinyl transferase EntD